VLDAQRTGSGIWYSGGGYNLRGKGNTADFTRPGKPATHCTAG
jgi:membrane-bound inhibitor of C-type lysozyme